MQATPEKPPPTAQMERPNLRETSANYLRVLIAYNNRVLLIREVLRVFIRYVERYVYFHYAYFDENTFSEFYVFLCFLYIVFLIPHSLYLIAASLNEENAIPLHERFRDLHWYLDVFTGVLALGLVKNVEWEYWYGWKDWRDPVRDFCLVCVALEEMRLVWIGFRDDAWLPLKEEKRVGHFV